MQRLTPDMTTEFLARHFKFSDGVITHATLLYVEHRLHCTVHVEVKDRQAASGWSFLALKFEEVSFIQVRETPATNVVMSPYGAEILFSGGLVYMDFSPVTDTGYSLHDFEQSTFAVRAASLWVTTEPWLDA
ncbi:hypothetical protein [Deinococcus sp. QL22]|uniref:hypothetical protein n=1 Tax=Deinococcus sp. QL22 TaxID=2939437 RepID=UPI0020180CE5|nr:hypothetical protein [Deinococcus sp. QL22]UQN08525.1 hypothetical protein M1R55_17625 [Deinococcus sp. QL22]